jgi:hypothetical protein
VAGRRGSPPRAGGGSALARNHRSRAAARKCRGGQRSPPWNDRSRGGHSGPHIRAAEGPERREERPPSERDREPTAPSPSGAAASVTSSALARLARWMQPPRLRGAPLYRFQIGETLPSVAKQSPGLEVSPAPGHFSCSVYSVLYIAMDIIGVFSIMAY